MRTSDESEPLLAAQFTQETDQGEEHEKRSQMAGVSLSLALSPACWGALFSSVFGSTCPSLYPEIDFPAIIYIK